MRLDALLPRNHTVTAGLAVNKGARHEAIGLPLELPRRWHHRSRNTRARGLRSGPVDSAGVPWGTGWTKLSIGLPDYVAAQAVLDNAIVQGTCR